ncbi:MAG: aminodeoxychorismate synthase component I [Lentisphaeraceae bacterium]|nr:aminodeoxychorismate synthase component I [Lentisphaeraceae bacterium]
MKFLVKDPTDNKYFYADCCEKVLVANEVREVKTVLGEVEKLQSENYWLAGWVSYEASPAFDVHHKVISSKKRLPLAYFMAVKDVKKLSLVELIEIEAQVPVKEVVPHISKEEYEKACSDVLAYIHDGEIYQANYSFRSHFKLKSSALSFFLNMEKQHPVPYSFFMDTDEWQVISQSPELFLERQGKALLSKPMKGTVKRALDFATDEKLRVELTEDEKSRAENVMIVDLMRNDMSRVCELNSIKVPQLFQADRYASLHQLISTVSGEVRKETSLVDIFDATFPAGSITGAPKIRSMEIIAELEKEGRGLYTGSAGIFKPRKDFTLNVCIRTIVSKDGQAELGIGSGIVADSAQSLEWEECLLKSSFINFRKKHSEVFETMLWEKGEVLYFEEHIQRLKNSCEYFLMSFVESEVRQFIQERTKSCDPARKYRLRLSIGVLGKVILNVVEQTSASEWSEKLRVLLSSETLDSQDVYLYHKTDCRELYNKAFKQAKVDGFDEVLFLNEKGELCEGAISNVFIKVDGKWFTPPTSSGLLPGTWRLAQLVGLDATEKVLYLEDLRQAEQIMIGNSVRLGANVNEVVLNDHGDHVRLYP